MSKLTRVKSSGILDETLNTEDYSNSSVTLEKLDIANTGLAGQVLSLGTSGRLEFIHASSGSSYLAGLTDVDVSSAAIGDVLGFDGTKWISKADSQGVQEAPINSTNYIRRNGSWEPISSAVYITGLADTTNTPVANGYLRWNSSGDSVIYQTTIQASSISGLATVATSGAYSDLSGLPSLVSNLNGLTDVTLSSPLNGQVLQYNGTGWTNSTPLFSGESNTASNLGAGNGLYAGKVGVDLQFKSLTAGSNITISSTANTLTISGPAPGETNTGTNLGTGAGVYASKFGSTLQFKSLVAGSNITLTNNSNEIIINSSSSATSLDGLTDVQIITPSAGQVLSYNGTEWVNQNSGSTTTEWVKINYFANGMVDTFEKSSGVSTVSFPTNTTTTVYMEVTFDTTKTTPPTSTFFYGYAYETKQYVQKIPVVNGNYITYTSSTMNGDFPAMPLFGNFATDYKMSQKVDRAETGASNGTGLPPKPTHAYIVWKF